MKRLFAPSIWARALSVILCFSPSLALSDAKQSSTHVMQWVEGGTIHIANQGGAINRHGDVKVEVEVFSSKQVIVTDSGTRSEHNLYSNYWSKDATTWTNTWHGVWNITGDAMQLELTLKERQCKHQKTWSDAAPVDLSCGAVSKQLKLACKAEQVTTEDLSRPSPGRATVSVWVCSPAETADLADTPSRWVLGKASCVKVVAGHSGFSYQKCKAP